MMYHKREITILTFSGFPWHFISQVQVHVRYQDPDTDWTDEGTVVLDPGKQSALLTFLARKGVAPEVSYRLSLLRERQKPIETQWETTREDLILVGNPFADVFHLTVLTVGGNLIENIVVDVKYEDEENDLLWYDTAVFNRDQVFKNNVSKCRFPLVDPAKRTYWYKETVVNHWGHTFKTEWALSEDPTLVAGTSHGGEFLVEPTIVGPPFSDNGVEVVKVKISYQDTEHDYGYKHEMLFHEDKRVDGCTIILINPVLQEYTYEMIYHMRDGSERKIGPLTSSDTRLVISSIPPEE